MFAKRGDYRFTTKWQSKDLPDFLIIGEGSATRFLGGAQLLADVIDTTKVSLRDLLLEDRLGVMCDFSTVNPPSLGKTSSYPLGLEVDSPSQETRFLGNYIRIRTLSSGAYPALHTCHQVLNVVESTPVRRIVFRATVMAKPEPRQAQSPNYYPLFAEPAKGDSANFYGFYGYPTQANSK